MVNAQFIMLVSIFCFSLAGYFSSLLAIHLLAFAMFIRFLLPAVFSVIKFKNFSLLKNYKPSVYVLCVMRGAIIFASQYLLYLTIHELGLSSGLILYNLGPIFLIVMFTMFGNKLKIQDIVLITLSFIGVLVFFDFEFKLSNMGMFLGITAAVLYAASQYINANMAKDKTDPKLIIMLVNLAASAIAAVYLLFFVGEPPQFSHMHVSTWLIITAMGLATYFNQYLRIIAFKLVDNPNTIVYLTYFCIPFSLLFTYFEGTMIAPDQIYGSIIILGGATVQGYLSRKMAKSRKTVEEPTESSLPEAVSNS